jgi:hypothetical protein
MEEAGGRIRFSFSLIVIFSLLLPVGLWAQTNCDEGNGPLDSAQPKALTGLQVIEKLGVAEGAAKLTFGRRRSTRGVSLLPFRIPKSFETF